MLKINENITIEDWELIENFVRSSGPGGQNEYPDPSSGRKFASSTYAGTGTKD